MPEIGRFFGVDPISEEYFSISTYQFAHNNPVWKIELEGLEGATSTGNGNDDTINHEPVKSEQRAFRNVPVLTVTTGKVVQETTKQVAKKKIGQQILSTVGNALKVGGTVIGALLTDSMSPNFGTTNEVPFQSYNIDEKHRLDDKIVRTEGDSDSPIRRMGDFDENIESRNSVSKVTFGKNFGKKVRKHIDQVRKRSNNGMIDDIPSPGKGGIEKVQEIIENRISQGNGYSGTYAGEYVNFYKDGGVVYVIRPTGEFWTILRNTQQNE